MAISRKEWTKVISGWAEVAESQGWRVENVQDGVKFYPKDRAFGPIVVHRTLSDHRSEKNYRARLRRSGLEI